jgi:hypothetical protein
MAKTEMFQGLSLIPLRHGESWRWLYGELREAILVAA